MCPTYVALDLETTGLDQSRDEIIEVGAVRFDGQRELDVFQTLVNPGRPIPLSITKLTGITDRDVITAPPFSAVREKLCRFVGDDVVVGHNVAFDLGFLGRQNCLRDHVGLDTLELATILMPNEHRYGLEWLVARLEIALSQHHRALDDARATMHLLLALQSRAEQLPLDVLNRICHAADSVRWSSKLVFQDALQRLQTTHGRTFSHDPSVVAPILSKPLPAEPLTPVDQRTALNVEALTTMLKPGGALSKAFPGFEYRPQQVEMMQAVADAFNHGRHLMVEAGTGTGKSIAYLLPAIYWAVRNGERVVVSTNTINLQDQLYTKDIPDLSALLPFEVRAALLKGRSNYLCPRRLQALQVKPDLTLDEVRVLTKVLVWLPFTQTGDRAELSMYRAGEWNVWSQIASDADRCTAERCLYRRQGGCFYHRARRQAENAHITIVNHALLLSDVAAENRVLPAYNYLIVDEAHHLEDATTQQLGYSVNRWNIESLLVQIGLGEGSFGGYLDEVLVSCRGRVPEGMMQELQDQAAALGEQGQQAIKALSLLFQDLTVFVAEYQEVQNQYDQRVPLTRELRIQPEWEHVELTWDRMANLLQAVQSGFEHLLDVLSDLEGADVPGYDDLVQDGRGLLQQFKTVYERAEAVLLQPRAGEITWVQTRVQTDELLLCSVPLHIHHLVEQHLLWPKESVILTSATLCTNGDFSFIKERLGAGDAEELAVGSPFDYESQVLLYLPTDMPEPNEPHHQKYLNQSLIDLALAIRGRMLVLFTSYQQLRSVYSTIYRPLNEQGITVLAQGEGPSRTQLLDSFRHTPGAVLLGTRSFWEGVDVPGEALSCLVVVKLPFAVPSDPIFAARAADMDDPFLQYAVPDAILRFRQGFGRLIRTRTDRGVVVVMDSRVQNKKYGEMFIDSLPVCTMVRGSLADLPNQAALWIDQGIAASEGDRPSRADDDGELEYVSFDDL